MARASLLLLLLFFTIQVHAHPLSFLRKLSATSQEGGWLWGWVWGAESSVSVVDRSPPLTFYSRPAAFGRELKDPLLGYVIPLSSFTTSCPSSNTLLVDHHSNSGCPELCISGPHQPDPSESWIALVQRGRCSFVDKVNVLVQSVPPDFLILHLFYQVREAQRLGARAAVIGGQDPDVSGQADTLVNMYSTGSLFSSRSHRTTVEVFQAMLLTSKLLLPTSNGRITRNYLC
jgi:E3 ubiquitin-protein ligase RNF13/E3 ubiquitin-protein ligase RNF167